MRNDLYGGYSIDEGEFGPGTALVLSLFAVFLLVAVLVWSQDSGGHSPVTMSILSEDKSYFKPGEASLGSTAKAQIADAVRRSRSHTQFNHFQVIGYASPEGSNNRELAERRAKQVRDYMVNSLHVPDECVIVANFSDSHSPSLRDWLGKGTTQVNSLESFRSASVRQQKTMIDESKLAGERMVAILGVYHQDSICRLDKIPQ